MAAKLGFADGAGAFPTKTDELPDQQDFTDIFILSQQPTVYDLKIEIKPDNRVYLEGPKMEVGQGFMTMMGMVVADGLDVPFESMDVICSPAEQKRGAAQITGFAQHPCDVGPGSYRHCPDAWPADGGCVQPPRRAREPAPH
jgi:hypothetical protein